MANETISEKCETLYNKLNTFVTSVISRDVTPKISNLNTEVWGSNTQTGDSRIDTLESDVTSLSDSITNHTTTFTDMIKIYNWSIPTFSLESGKRVEKTVTVPNPTGYYRIPFIQGAYKCSASSMGLSGTTLTVKIQNHYTTNANASMYGVILYIKSSIITVI